MRTIGTLIAIVACAAYAQQREPLKPRQGQVIGPEDTISISAVEAEEISKAWRVDSAGELNLPMVGRIQAAGMTVKEFERTLTGRLKRYYRYPQVSAHISEMRSRPITVMGPVEKPGTYQLQESRTLLDVLALAGGPKETAGSQVTLARLRERGRIGVPGTRQDETGKYDVLELDLKEVMAGHSASSAVPVEAYDVVTVSEFKPQKLVHIAGEVNKPGAVELVSQPTVSLMKVLAVAGGLTRTSSPGRTMIVHLNEKGVQTSTAFVNMKKIMNGEARDLELTAGDIVIVPSSTLMSYVQAASLSAVTTGIYILGRF
jgi:polysaccharide export outer membrane protein